jgi:hypothetical protein
MHRRQFVTAIGTALATLGLRSVAAATPAVSGTCLAPQAATLFASSFESGEAAATHPPYYLPERRGSPMSASISTIR